MTRNAKDAAVAARHADIPQDALFDVDAEDPAATGTVDTKRKRYVKSVEHGTCPTCGHDEIGQVRDGAGLAWRDHFVMVGRHRIRCSGSGAAVVA